MNQMYLLLIGVLGIAAVGSLLSSDDDEEFDQGEEIPELPFVDGTDDPDLRSLLDDILAGRTSPRQLLAHEGFGEQLRDAGEALHRRYENLSPDRRAEEAKASEDAVQRIFGPELDALRRRVEELRAAHEPPAGPHPA